MIKLNKFVIKNFFRYTCKNTIMLFLFFNKTIK